MSRAEFVGLIALMFATISFSIDAILPAFPEIGKSLSPDDLNKAQLILTAFMMGMGLGTFFTGPLSDAFGRKSILFLGCGLYMAGAFLAWISPSLELILVSRLLMGLGAAAPRVVAIAVVRDVFSGREMARIMSIAMMFFTLVPAIAPMMGQAIIALAGWRSIFITFMIFALIVVTWMGTRLPETLEIEARRPFKFKLLMAATAEMMQNPTVRLSIIAQTLCLSVLVTLLSMVQQVYEQVFDRGATFPMWFGLVALLSGSASLLNATFVVRIGMRRMVTWSLIFVMIMTAVFMLITQSNVSGDPLFYCFVTWQTCIFFMFGTTLGNLNSIAMEPMGHIAGMAASVTGAVSTVVAVALASPIGQMFDGTLTPLVFGVLILISAAYAVMIVMGRVEARTAPAE